MTNTHSESIVIIGIFTLMFVGLVWKWDKKNNTVPSEYLAVEEKCSLGTEPASAKIYMDGYQSVGASHPEQRLHIDPTGWKIGTEKDMIESDANVLLKISIPPPPTELTFQVGDGSLTNE